MTIETSISKTSFNGSGSTGPFTFTFRFFDNSDIVIKQTAVDGTITTLVEGPGAGKYVLTGAGNYAGGSVTLGTALAVGEVLTIRRILPLTQLTSIRNLGAFFPQIHENVFDKLTMVLQQLTTNDQDVQDAVDASELAFYTAMDAAYDAFTASITGQQNAYEIAITAQQNNYEIAITAAEAAFEASVNASIASKANVDNTVLTGNISATLTVADNDLFNIKDQDATGLFTVDSAGNTGTRGKATVGSLAIGATDVTATAAEINTLASSGITQADLIKVHAVTATAAEVNTLAASGITNADLVKVHAVTATAAELNKLAGTPAGLTATEIGYLDGVTSGVQAQIDGKPAYAKQTATGYTDGSIAGLTIGGASKTVRIGDLVVTNFTITYPVTVSTAPAAVFFPNFGYILSEDAFSATFRYLVDGTIGIVFIVGLDGGENNGFMFISSTGVALKNSDLSNKTIKFTFSHIL